MDKERYELRKKKSRDLLILNLILNGVTFHLQLKASPNRLAPTRSAVIQTKMNFCQQQQKLCITS
jgi:hypothetical protein